MFLRRSRYRYKGELREYAQIVEAFRDEKGRPMQRVVKSLWRINTEADWEKAKRFLKRMKTGEKLITLGELELKGCLEFGTIYVAGEIWNRVGMPEVLGSFQGPKRKFDFEKTIFLLTANRLSEPGSERAAYEWIQREAFVEGKERVAEHHLYRALDLLVANKTEIERAIFKRLKRTIDTSKVFYDLTSSYFEGTTCVLAEFGYSRDRKRGKKQFVLGLVLADGLPIAHFVFPGNTTDKTTLKQTVEYLRREFKIKRIIFVADRGLFSPENLDFLDEEEYEYILALKRRRDKEAEELMSAPIKTGRRVAVREVKREENRRYILCFNRDVEREEREHLREVRRSLERKLKELAESYRREGRGRKPSPENLIHNAVKALGKHKRLFDVKFDGGLTYSLNRESWEYENKIAGRFLLATTAKLPSREVMEAYKQLARIEQAFRELKSFLKLRPVFHPKEHRVRAHAFVCVLSFLLEALMQRKLSVPVGRALRELKRMRVATIDIEGEEVEVLAKLNKEQMKILKELEVEAPPGIL